MNPTMQDVATLAGVSVKTVSNVVNNYPHIRDTTKAKVLQAIDSLGYQMNMSARSLRSGKTGMIGLAVPELSLPYFAELADSVIEYADSVGLTVLIEQTGGDARREREALCGQRRSMTDGLIFSPLAMESSDLGACQVNFPMVLLGERIFDAGSDHVTMHNVDGARSATEFLIERGCRKIVLLGSHDGEVVGSAALRTTGYLAALDAHGIAVDSRFIREAGLWHRETGAAAMAEFLQLGVAFDGVVALNDAMALGALYVLQKNGISVPEQVKVIGFDNINDSQYSYPTLTTVEPGRKQIAHTAVDLLKKRIDAPAKWAGPRRVIADYTIIERDSTAQG